MKKFKRIISLLLSAVMFVSCFSAEAVFAMGQKTAIAEISTFESAPIRNGRAGDSVYDNTEFYYSDIMDYIMRGVYSYSDYIDLRKFAINIYQLVDIINYMICNELFYFVGVDSELKYNEYNADAYGFIPHYTMPKSEVQKGNEMIYRELNEMAAAGVGLKTNTEKVLFVHQYVLSKLQIDVNISEDNIYKALLTGKASCFGYAQLFNFAARKLGVSSYIVFNEKTNYCWNFVNLRNTFDANIDMYFHVDCLMDDFQYEEPDLICNPLSGVYGYEYCMRTAKSMYSELHGSKADWNVNAYSIEHVTYSDDFFADLIDTLDTDTSVIYHDGAWYNVAPCSDESNAFSIYKTVFTSGFTYETSEIRRIKSSYLSSDIVDMYYSQLQKSGNTIFYRTSDGIYALDTTSDNVKDDKLVFTHNKSGDIYDFIINDNHTFTVVTGEKRNDKGVYTTYNNNDYFCKTIGHDYVWESADGKLVFSCAFCGSVSYSLQFTDLGGYEYYGDFVAYTSYFNKFISGTNPPQFTEFSPTAPITRAMFVTILYRMAGEPYKNANPYEASPFTDITDTGTYYYDAACWAFDNKITNQTTFKPYDNVTREQTATFLFRYAKDNDSLGDDGYKDVKLNVYLDDYYVSEWAVEAIKWANYNGMITGTQQGTVNPKGATQRIHATKILYGFGETCGIGDFE